MGQDTTGQFKKIIFRLLSLLLADSGDHSDSNGNTCLDNGYRVRYISSELMEEILTRLPVKSLLRFKSVCKDWKGLINGPEFINKQLEFSIDKCASDESTIVLGWVCADPSSESNEYAINYKLAIIRDDQISLCPQNVESCNVPSVIESYSEWNTIFGSHCNGVVCLINCLPDEKHQALFYNPALRQHQSMIIQSRPGYLNGGFAFGCSTVTKDYKLVRLLRSDYNLKPYKAEVYNISTNSVKEVDLAWNFFMHYESGLYCNGRCYWIGDLNDTNRLFFFDLADDRYDSVALPTHTLDTDRRSKLYRLLVQNRSIVFAVLSWDRNNTEICLAELWQSQTLSGDDWVKRTITFRFAMRTILAFWKEDQLLIEDCGGQVILYSISTDTTTVLVDSFLMLPFSAFGSSYIESLKFV